jgi:hypothetical protein
MSASDHLITTIEQLEAIYGEPYGPAVAKEIDHSTRLPIGKPKNGGV